MFFLTLTLLDFVYPVVNFLYSYSSHQNVMMKSVMPTYVLACIYVIFLAYKQ